ncbi:hypothetical protein [Sphingorhabdus sp. YGSMI21]|uniref:lipopolysaccharide biosynthesis protein n=1 Tax=Sphingorhabdus sp. YGSMI21 TaxID=2077182 RepID=UPI000F5000AD|nr:hypothetical protein [Sphingorhabdus sp. YGSMI21]
MTLAINTRALGITYFGILIIIQSTTELVVKIFGFTTWRALHKFGADDVAAGRYDLLRQRYRFGFILDLGAALFSTIITIIAFAFFSTYFGLDEETRSLGMLYSFTNLFQGTSASVGILRITERFGLAVIIQVIGAACLLGNALVLYAIDAPFAIYIYTVGGIVITWNTALNLAGFIVVQSRVAHMEGSHAATNVDYKTFLNFALASSAGGTLKGFRQRGEVLIVAAFLGPEGASIYGVAYRIGALFARFVDAATQAIYPEFALLVAKREFVAAKRLVFKMSGIGLVATLPVLLLAIGFGGILLALAFGAEFASGQFSLVWLLIAYLIPSALFALAPYSQLAFGAGRFLGMEMAAFVAFLAAACAGPYFLGIQGAGLGTAAFTVVLFGLLVYQALTRRPAEKSDDADGRWGS